ncbi:MAG: hypothetical protein FWE11_08825 [Defluviitaleaceae bacterium]|nr:hypothetical protein [Defluviitaleaceae bacterium]
MGAYLVNAQIGDFNDQVIVQITDLAIQVVADNDRAIVWANDMITGQPVSDLTVVVGQSRYTTDNNGIAVVASRLSQDEELTLIHNSLDIPLFLLGGQHTGGWWWGPTIDQNYWTVLQLDRTLFQRSDTLYFWGFVQNRQANEEIRNVTATITHGWRWDADTRDILHRQSVSVTGGIYSGAVQLPHLDPGGYVLEIRHQDALVGSIFFHIQDYVTPSYEILVSSDRQAIFAGEEVTFTARAQFFDGTPVSELPINYRFWGWALRDIPGGRITTDIDGEHSVSATPTVTQVDAQGRVHLEMSVDAVLPEVGDTFRSAFVEVFVNDIDVQVQASREDENASLLVNVHNITLDRINDGTSEHWMDILCDPVQGQVLDVEIYRVYWEPVRDGEFYCFIERRVIPRYRHNRIEEVIDRFQLTTDANGEANIDFTVPDREYESYHARITTRCGFGRTITHQAFIGRDFWNFFWQAEENQPFLYNPRDWNETYNIGDEVELTVKRGTEAVAIGNFLFVVMQNGIIDFQVGATNPFTFTFSEEHVPNTIVHAYHFNGHTYHSGWNMNAHLRFNSDNRGLQINVDFDQETYRPGDMAGLNITVTDPEGNPKAANINISVVDEALFALQNYTVETLASLYQSVGDGRLFSISTHRTFVSDGDTLWGSPAPQSDSMYMADMAVSEEADAQTGYGGSGGDTHLRQIFRDTSVFASERTNAGGVADFSFQLPDNITSWRVTVSAISSDLYAGNTVANIIVTNPMFLHYALGSTFLVGDVPTIGVNAYGTSLTGDETIIFEVWCENDPDNIFKASGTAFERINIPLWEMTEEGLHALIIHARVEGNPQLSDAMRHEFQVIRTNRQVDMATFYDVTTQTRFEAGSQGLTNITFTDHGRGQFLRDLLGMRHIRGARLEGLTARQEAERLLGTHFPDTELWHLRDGSFNPLDYQRPDGGLSILPHAESDLATTVMLLPFLLEGVNVGALRNYLYGIFEGENPDNKMMALYGLALLQAPVLLDLHQYALVADLPVRDVAFIALGFAALGETAIALDIYQERILPHIQKIEPMYRVYSGLGSDSILEATSTVSLLAAKLNMPERLGLHQYTANHRTSQLLITIERLHFISHEIANHSPTPASITYTLFGETFTRDLSHGWGWGYTLRIPTQNMNQFRLTNVTGDVGAVSINRVPLEEIEIVDNDIAINRRFLREGGAAVTGAFRQDEVVRVEISIDYSAKAIDGSYMVTDFLPAGLAFVQGSARFVSPRTGESHWSHAIAEGQRVIFFDYNGRFDGVRVYYYYARVINPGVFTAEGTLVQNLGVRAYMTVGEDTTVTVE